MSIGQVTVERREGQADDWELSWRVERTSGVTQDSEYGPESVRNSVDFAEYFRKSRNPK